MSALVGRWQRPADALTVLRSPAGFGAIMAGGTSLDVVRVWPSGHSGCIVLLRDADGGRWGAADFGDEDPPAGILAGRTRGDVWPLDSARGFAWRYGSDPALALRRALSPTAVRVLDAAGERGCMPGRPDVLSYKPLQRSVLRFPRAGGPALIVKLYGGQRDERAGLIPKGLLGLRQLPGVSIRVLKPSARVREWRALLWPQSAGGTLHAQLSAPQAGRLAALAGKALACLHGGTAEWQASHRREDELAGLESWARLAGRVWPEHHGRLQHALEWLKRGLENFTAVRLVPSHRDFHDKQLLVDEADAAIMDLDMACLAEAELDIGNMLAHLRLRVLQGRLATGSPVPGAFRDAYAEVGGSVDRGRLSFYESCARLRLACVYALRPRWASLVPRLIDEACGAAQDMTQRRY